MYFPIGTFKLKGYSAERKGEREDMQDAHLVMDDFMPEVDKPPVGMYALLSISSISDIKLSDDLYLFSNHFL